jgi:glycosyltransferase involved in cell wall biosynthesis
MITVLSMTHNEQERLPRMMESAVGFADSFTIVENGQDTWDNYIKYDPVYWYTDTWENFGVNRARAYDKADADWVLFLDADMTVSVHPDFKKWLEEDATADCYLVQVFDGDLSYHLPLLTRGKLGLKWLGSTHEYVDLEGRNCPIVSGISVTHHNDGANRSEKFIRDIGLLVHDAQNGESRATYYLAQSYRCLALWEDAYYWYMRRANMENSWEEERWHALYCAGVCALNYNVDRGIEILLDAWRQRPQRSEPLAAIQYWAAKSKSKNPPVEDTLFIEPAAYS